LKLLAANWQVGSTAPAVSLDGLLASLDLPPVQVPEPSAACIIAFASGAIALRRRCR
jgi:hypothetical protein